MRCPCTHGEGAKQRAPGTRVLVRYFMAYCSRLLPSSMPRPGESRAWASTLQVPAAWHIGFGVLPAGNARLWKIGHMLMLTAETWVIPCQQSACSHPWCTGICDRCVPQNPEACATP